MTQRGRDADGLVYLVGAGPGDPGLLTCRGRECLEAADVVIYDGLAPAELLTHTRPECEHIYAGKKHSAHGSPHSQEEINALLIERARAGQVVVRLKGGDPFVFGRGAEECMALADAGLRFEVVPGVSAATAVPAYAGIPLTARGIAATAVLVTGHEATGKSDGAVDWSAVAGHSSIVLFMAWKHIGECVAKLVAAGKAARTPAAAIRWGTRARQSTLKTTLGALPDAIAKEGMRPPILVVIGEVVEASEALAWFETRPLFGKRIWLTRERARAGEAYKMLRAQGAEVVVAPTTRIELASADELRDFGQRLVTRDWEWLVLTSANGVRAVQEALERCNADGRALGEGKIAVVGRATELALRSIGLRADLVSKTGTGVGLADALLDELATVGGVRILFPRARGGREEAAERLTAAGCEVDVVDIYESIARHSSEPVLAELITELEENALDAVAFFAPSQLEALVGMHPKALAHLARVPVLAAVGPTTAAALQKRGLTVRAVAASPDAESLTRAIEDAFFAGLSA